MGKRGKTGEHLNGRVGAAANGWRGGRHVGPYGYVYVWVPIDHPAYGLRGRAPEHRLVMSESLGRPLLQSEIVHHINHDKTDNRRENLELTSRTGHMLKHVTWDRSPRECPACSIKFVPPRKPRGVVAYCSRKCALTVNRR